MKRYVDSDFGIHGKTLFCNLNNLQVILRLKNESQSHLWLLYQQVKMKQKNKLRLTQSMLKSGKESVQEEQKSVYPQSLSQSGSRQLSSIQIKRLSADQQQLVSEYIQRSCKKEKHQLLTERQQLLEQLQTINNHLNEMITKLYGDLSSKNSQQINKIQEMSQQTDQISLKQPQGKNKQSLEQSDLNKLSPSELDLLEQRNQKLIAALIQELQDYEFMLTGQYYERLDQQLQIQQAYKKDLHQQVLFLDKQVKKFTKSYDKQTLAKIQKLSYDSELQLTLQTKKLQAKIQKLTLIKAEDAQKRKKIQSLSYQEADLQKLLQMYEDEQYQSPETNRQKMQNIQKLQIKKEKLEKIINSYNNNHLKIYNKKLSQFRDLEMKINQIGEQIKQMNYNILFISKQRKEFQQQNKEVISNQHIFASLGNVRKNSLQSSILSKNKQKADTSDSFLSKRNRQKFVTQHNQPELKNQDKYPRYDQEEIQHKKNIRRRIYTQLQNSHYFSSLQRNYQKGSINQQTQNVKDCSERQNILDHIKKKKEKDQVPTSDKQIMSSQENSKYGKIRQKKFNKNAFTPKSLQYFEKSEPQSLASFGKSNNNFAKTNFQDLSTKIKDSKRSINRKGVSKQRQVQKQDQIQRKLIGLQRMLNKNEINIKSYDKAEEESFDLQVRGPKNLQRINGKKSITRNSLVSANQKSVKSNISSKNQKNHKYYKQLCQKLGKDKLLIEEDQDINGLIYQGMTSKTQYQ